MKKKMRRFSEGDTVREGPHAGIDDDTRAKARAFVREQGMQELLKGLGEGPKASEPAASSSSSTPVRSKYVGSTNDAGGEGAPRSTSPKPTAPPPPKTAPKAGRFTDSDADSRAARQSEADDENVRRIQRARDEADNSERINRANYRTTSDRVIEEPDVPHGDTRSNAGPRTIKDRLKETFLSGGAGDVRNIAGALAGPTVGSAGRAVGRALGIPSARASAERTATASREAGKEFSRPQARIASEDTVIEGSRRFMEAANKRAQAARAAKVEKAKPTLEKLQARDAKLKAKDAARSAERRQEGGEGQRFAYEGGRPGFKKGGKVGASRGDGIAQRGHTRGKYL